jgi:uncharacterized protein
MRKELKGKLRDLGVSIVYLFGSKATGSSSRLSDVDIGVVLKTDDSQRKDHRAVYHRLYDLFSGIYPTLKLDIAFLNETPLSLQYAAIREGKILFEEDPTVTADYEQQVMNQYLDFKPVLDLFDRMVSERYAET